MTDARVVRVGLAQIDIRSLDAPTNLARIEEVLDALRQDRPDLVVFPELSNIGQVGGRDAQFGAEYAGLAETLDGPFVRRIGELARAHACHVCVGLAEADERISGLLYNTAIVVDAEGRLVLRQRKLHPAGEERHYFGPGSGVAVATTELGVLSVAICYDLYFPEVARASALAGSELMIGIFNVTYRAEWPDRLAQLAAVRSYENMQHVVALNRVGSQADRRFGGESAVAAPPGVVIHRAPALEEHICCVELDQAAVRRERAYRAVFADRRTDLYHPIHGGDVG